MALDASRSYLIRSSNGSSVVAGRGQGVPKLVSGGARYDLVNRPRRKSVVQWSGDDPYRMDVPIMLDGWDTHTSIEADVSKLNLMYQSRGELVPPATVSIDGAVPVKGAKWVIESIDWGDEVIWTVADKTGKGHRLRQDAVIHLLQYVEESVLERKKPSTGATPHRVKAGESAAAIAAANKISMADLKKANSIRDLKTIRAGQLLKIPPPRGR